MIAPLAHQLGSLCHGRGVLADRGTVSPAKPRKMISRLAWMRSLSFRNELPLSLGSQRFPLLKSPPHVQPIRAKRPRG